MRLAARHVQRFVSVHGLVLNLFHVGRHRQRGLKPRARKSCVAPKEQKQR